MEQQTCSSVVTHPDPCPHCWPAMKAKPTEPRLALFTKRSSSEAGYVCDTGDDGVCSRCGRSQCKHKHHCQGSRLSLLFEDQSINRPPPSDTRSTNTANFGPWSDRTENRKSVDDMWPGTYEPSMLSTDHQESQRAERRLFRDDRELRGSFQGMARLRRGRDDSRRSSLVTRNSWSLRDESNLRFPCISTVLGTLNKSDAHAR